jgi:hypothetical protein
MLLARPKSDFCEPTKGKRRDVFPQIWQLSLNSRFSHMHNIPDWRHAPESEKAESQAESGKEVPS